MSIFSKRQWLMGLSAISSVLLVQSVTLAQCPPPGAVTFPSCCSPYSQVSVVCGIPMNKPYMRFLNPPTVTITPDSSNPNIVDIAINNGAYHCASNAACTDAFCGFSPPSYTKIPYYQPNSLNIAPAITRKYPSSAWVGGNQNRVDLTKLPANQCTIEAKWSAGCGYGLHTDIYPMGPCQLPPQTKPQPKPQLNQCKAKLSPGKADCQPGKPDPVDPYSGDYYYAEADLEVPGLIPLRVVRSYKSSLSGLSGPFGVGTYLANYNYVVTAPTNPDGTVNTSPNQVVLLNEGNGLTTAFSNGSSGGLTFTNNGTLGTAGDTLTLTLDGSNFLSSAEYLTSENNKFQFDADGYLTQSQDDSGNTVTFTRDTQGKLLTASSLGRSLTFTYNSANLIQEISDHTGRLVRYSYSPSNQLMTVIDPLENTMTYTWDAQNRIQSVMDKRNKANVLNTYQDNGMLKQQTMFVGTTTATGVSYRLDATGPLTRKVTDPNGNTTEYTYNSEGLLIQETDGLNHSKTITYSPNLFNGTPTGRYIEKTDSLSHTTHIDLNANNLPTALTNADNKTITITYDTVWTNKPKTITDALNQTTTFTYDSSGNLIEIEDPANNSTTMTYNTRGQVLTVTNALNKTTTYTYNSSGDLISITDPLNRTTTFAYDTLGRMIDITDPKNQTTQFEYNANNWLLKIADALNGEKTFTYDGNGNVTGSKNARNNTTTHNYDNKNRLIRTYEPGSLLTSYLYDNADRLTRITDPKNQQRNFTYDAANRLTQEQVKVGSTVESTYTYTYDNADRLLTIGDGSNTWSMTYDVVNRTTQVVSPQGTVNYTYDANSHRTQMTATGHTAVDYAYDVLDRLTSITQGSQVYGYVYDAIGRRTSLTRPNAVTSSYTYDDANQLTQLRHLKTGVLDEQHDYTYDNNGNILTSIRDTANTRTYTYDALDRLTRMVKSPVPGEPLPKQIDWAFDANSNITQRQETDDANVVTTYGFTYNVRDWMTQRTTNGGSPVSFTYDNNGNLSSDGLGRSLTWNGQDQLASLTVGGVTTSFLYDPLGRRTKLTQGVLVKNYLYDDLDMVADGTNKYLNGASLDEPLQLDTGSNTHSYLADHLGSVTRLTNATGAGTGQYVYGPYGSQLSSSSPLAGNPFTYTARENDATGLLYYRARYYDPSLELFISQDPLGDAQRYVGGNPLRYSDPLGLEYWDFNVSGGFGFGITGGFFVSPKGIHPYVGGGLTTPGVGASINYSPFDVSPQCWSGQGAVQVGPFSGAAGYGGGSPFWEAGLGWGLPAPLGVSGTGYYTFGNIK
jgi:RHS repeat-associated protein